MVKRLVLPRSLSQAILLVMFALPGKGCILLLQLQSMYQEGMESICCPVLAFANQSSNCPRRETLVRNNHRMLVIDQTKTLPPGMAIRQGDLDKVPMFSSNIHI